MVPVYVRAKPWGETWASGKAAFGYDGVTVFVDQTAALIGSYKADVLDSVEFAAFSYDGGPFKDNAGTRADLLDNLVLEGPGTVTQARGEKGVDVIRAGMEYKLGMRGGWTTVIAPPERVKRMISAWVGGSIIGSLSSTSGYDQSGL